MMKMTCGGRSGFASILLVVLVSSTNPSFLSSNFFGVSAAVLPSTLSDDTAVVSSYEELAGNLTSPTVKKIYVTQDIVYPAEAPADGLLLMRDITVVGARRVRRMRVLDGAVQSFCGLPPRRSTTAISCATRPAGGAARCTSGAPPKPSSTKHHSRKTAACSTEVRSSPTTESSNATTARLRGTPCSWGAGWEGIATRSAHTPTNRRGSWPLAVRRSI